MEKERKHDLLDDCVVRHSTHAIGFKLDSCDTGSVSAVTVIQPYFQTDRRYCRWIMQAYVKAWLKP